MSFVRLKYRLRHAIRPIFYLIVAIFVIGGAFSFDSFQRSQRRNRGEAGVERKVPKYAVTINGKRMPRSDLDNYLWMIADRGSGIPVEMQRQAMMSWLNSRIDGVLMEQAIAAENIKVSGKRIRERREEIVDQQLAPQIEERTALAERLQREGINLEQYRQRRLAEFAQSPAGSDDAIRDDLQRTGLEDKIKGQVTVSDEDVKKSFEEVKAKHILLDPKAMKRKALEKLDSEKADLEKKLQAAKDAGKTPDPEVQSRLQAIEADRQAAESKDYDAEAKLKAEALLKEIRGGADFAKLAKENSDDPGSGMQGGDLGFFKRGRMVEEFDTAAFALNPGQVSEVVKSQFGYHIVKVEAKRNEVPKDFEKDKAKYRDQYEEEQKWRAWGTYQQKLHDSAQVEVHDPELAAYRILDEDNDEDKAITMLDQAVQNDPGNPGAKYELAKLWQSKGNKEKALALLQEVEKMEGAERSTELMMTLGDLLREQKRTDEALQHYKKASDLAAPLQQQNQYVHFRLEMAFREMKRTDLADQEKDWLTRFQKDQEKRGGSPFGGSFTVE